MKNFIKERNPFLLINFITSILIFLFSTYFVSYYYNMKLYDNFYGLDDIVKVEYLLTAEVEILFVVLFLFLVIPLVFIIIGYIYKKEELIFVSECLLLLILIISISMKLILFIIVIMFLMIFNILGLMKFNKNN